MALNPYLYLPKKKFFERSRKLALGLTGFGFLLAGALAPVPEVILARNSHAANPSFVVAEFYQYVGVSLDLARMRGSCISGNTVSDFQDRQCSEIWSGLFTELFWIVFPALFAVGGLWLGLEFVLSTYRRATRQIEQGFSGLAGTVTDPAEAPNDRYGRLHCFKAISVEMDKGRQIKIYLPDGAPTPKPGEQMRILDLKDFFGAHRYLGVPHMPHVVVVAGTRRQ